MGNVLNRHQVGAQSNECPPNRAHTRYYGCSQSRVAVIIHLTWQNMTTYYGRNVAVVLAAGSPSILNWSYGHMPLQLASTDTHAIRKQVPLNLFNFGCFTEMIFQSTLLVPTLVRCEFACTIRWLFTFEHTDTQAHTCNCQALELFCQCFFLFKPQCEYYNLFDTVHSTQQQHRRAQVFQLSYIKQQVSIERVVQNSMRVSVDVTCHICSVKCGHMWCDIMTKQLNTKFNPGVCVIRTVKPDLNAIDRSFKAFVMSLEIFNSQFV